jgi:clan AA aspartic protease (TIGR02281 family)
MRHYATLFRTTLAISLMLVAMAAASVAGPFEEATSAYQGRDYAAAMLILKPLADQGNAVAQYRVGMMYFRGEGVSKDYGEALTWFRKAADQGNAGAQFDIGVMYRNGQGVSQDYAESFQWYQSAADQGYLKAQMAIASMYHAGQGVQQNDAEALKWFGKAADQGNSDAQELVGFMYLRGKGTPKDNVRAYMWFNLSASRGNNDAVKYRDRTAYFMTPEQIADAQKMARDWKPQASQVASRDDEGVSRPLASNRNPPSPEGVPMKMDGGIFVVPVEINGTVTLDFAVDSGATYVSVPADVFLTLKRTGTVKDSDVVGQRTYILADGSKSQSATFTIRSLSVGNTVVENVQASVMPSQGSLLLGQSFLERLKSWSIDNTKHELLLEPQ